VALLIAVVVIAAAGALSFLGSRSDASLDEAGAGIHETPAASEGGGTSGGDPGGGSGGSGSGGGGGGSAGTTTTTTPSGQPTTTTTTVATTTTTTTTPEPGPASAGLSGGRGTRNGSSRWDASAKLQLDADDGTGSLAGTATVLVRWQRSNGQWSSDTIEVPIDADGRASIETGPYARTGSSRVNTVQYRVVGIELHEDREWDGDEPTISVPRPA